MTFVNVNYLYIRILNNLIMNYDFLIPLQLSTVSNSRAGPGRKRKQSTRLSTSSLSNAGSNPGSMIDLSAPSPGGSVASLTQNNQLLAKLLSASASDSKNNDNEK